MGLRSVKTTSIVKKENFDIPEGEKINLKKTNKTKEEKSEN